jgi:hypothetical protein
MQFDPMRIYSADTDTNLIAAAESAVRTMPHGQARQLLREQESALDELGFVLQHISAAGFYGGTHYLHIDGRKVELRGLMLLLVACPL